VKVIRIVFGPVASTADTAANAEDWEPSARSASIEATAAAASSLSPLWKVTPSRRVRSSTVLSALNLHSVAMPGSSSPAGLRSIRLS
jgi:hypothetical protein